MVTQWSNSNCILVEKQESNIHLQLTTDWLNYIPLQFNVLWFYLF